MWGFRLAALGGTREREEPGKRGQNRCRGQQHPAGQGRTVALPSKNLRRCLGLGLAPGMLCQAGAWISPQRAGPTQKGQEAIVAVPRCLLLHGHTRVGGQQEDSGQGR